MKGVLLGSGYSGAGSGGLRGLDSAAAFVLWIGSFPVAMVTFASLSTVVVALLFTLLSRSWSPHSQSESSDCGARFKTSE